jgi:hypothetical protein
VVFDIANVDKVGLIWFEFYVVKQDRIPLEVTRRDPITNYLRQGLLHPKVFVPRAYLTIEKTVRLQKKLPSTISPQEILAPDKNLFSNRSPFGVVYFLEAPVSTALIFSRRPGVGKKDTMSCLKKSVDKQAEGSGKAPPGQFSST